MSHDVANSMERKFPHELGPAKGARILSGTKFSMKEKLGCAAALIYLGIGIVQLLATIKGIQMWTGMPWLISALISMFVAYIPLVGTVAGIKGATDAWGWGFWSSVAFFCWPYVIYVLAIAVGGVATLMSRRPGK